MKKIALAAAITANIIVPCVGVYADAIDINFGDKLAVQEQNGYTQYTGKTTLDNFYQAKSELPDEVPVLNNFEVNGENVFFVAADGNDLADGTVDAPLATIGKALDKIENLTSAQKKRGSIIYMRGGEYEAYDTAQINQNHTDENGTLFISAYNNEKVILSGVKKAYMSQAEKAEKSNMSLGDYNRINDRALGHMYFIEYDKLGTDKTVLYGTPFYYNGIRLNNARYPNNTEDAISEVIKDGSYVDKDGFTRTGLPTEWKPLDSKPFEWLDNSDIHIIGRIANEWSITDGKITVDKTSKTIKSSDAGLMPNYSPITTNFWGMVASSYYYTNVFEELDSPGEMYADNVRKRLYFYPPSDTVRDNDTIGYPMSGESVFNVENAENVVFNGIEINGCKKGVNIKNSRTVVLQDMDIRNLTDSAVSMYNTEKCGIINSSAGEINSGDVSSPPIVSISQDSAHLRELKPCRNFVQNTYMYNSAKAITSNTTGNIISHNLIENIEYSGITLGGAENIIEYNEFSGVTNKISDGGAIYVGGNILNRANSIRYNYLHDSCPDKLNARAIYNDDCSDMSWNYGNVIKNYGFGLFQHSGDSHVIMDNTVINATTYIRNSADYAAQKTLMESYFFKQTRPGYWYNYDENEIGKSGTWMKRYSGILDAKYNELAEARTAYWSDSDMYNKIQNVLKKRNSYDDYTNGDDVKKASEIAADTDCWYINNTLVINGKNNWGYGPSDYGLNNTVEPNNGGKANEIICDNEEQTSSYDISDKISGIGLINSDAAEKEKPVISINKELEKSAFDGFSWSETAGASYYLAEVSTSPDFSENVISCKTSSAKYPVYKLTYDSAGGVKKSAVSEYEYQTDTPYYVRVTAVSLANCLSNSETVSDTAEFILRDSISYDRSDKGNVNVEYGTESHNVRVSGTVPAYLLNQLDKQVTVIVYEDGKTPEDTLSIKHIRQINPNSDNSFSYNFKADNIDKCRIRIKVGNNDLTDDMFSAEAIAIDEIKLDISADVINTGDIITAAADIDNSFGAVDEFNIIVAAYDSVDKLINCIKSDVFTPEQGLKISEAQLYTVPDDAAYVKAFVWRMTNIKPWKDEFKKNVG